MKKINFFLIISLVLFSSSGILAVPSVSYSLPADANGTPLDHKLIDIMNFKNGIFIEVGASDGIMYSNTKLFEEFYGWIGILIEPASKLFARLCANRPHSKCFSCALGSFEEDGTYAYGNFDGHPMGGFSQNVANQRVLIRSLQSILDECEVRHIHFFSLDVEGYELNVLHGIDFNKTTFDYLLVEISKSNHYDTIVSFLLHKGYDLVGLFSHGGDYLFKRKDYID